MLIGPLFTRELVTTPRRGQHFILRTVYVTGLFVLMCTAWLLLLGSQTVRGVGDMARFGSILFQILAPLQLALLTFLAAFSAAGAVAQEKDRQTLLLLLMTRLGNQELVLGKLLASLLNVLVMLVASAPLLMFLTLFGGVSFDQVAQVLWITLATVLAAGSLGSTVALAREKTFQSLAITALALVMWIGLWEAVAAAAGSRLILGLSGHDWATLASPVRALLAAVQPFPTGVRLAGWPPSALYVLVALALAALLNALAIVRLRVWNPGREVQPVLKETEEASPAPANPADAAAGEQARSGHVDARVRRVSGQSRQVWDNPVLWREMCTWAYGRKVLIIRLAYLALFALTAAGLHASLPDPSAGAAPASVIPPAARPLAPFFLLSLVIVNALAVTSITNERDGKALDLLLVTDLSPPEVLFGKLGGVAWVTKEMVLLPLALAGYLWWAGGLSLENFAYLAVGMLVLDLFAMVLGMHCGMHYASSRNAVGVSLGSVFFLFLGVATLIAMMISFSDSFQSQLAPFLTFVVGGSVGLFVALGYRNPSAAIMTASLLLPAATFLGVTSFLLEHWLTVFLLAAGAYGFASAAMLVPALYEFDIAMGRTKGPAEE